MERKPCPDGTEALPRWNEGREPPDRPAGRGLPALAACGRRSRLRRRVPEGRTVAAGAAALIAAGVEAGQGWSGIRAGLEWNPAGLV